MERAFKGIWIPKEIWLEKELNWVEKVLLVEIASLDNEEGCWASNGYFAEFFGLSKNRISVLINSLKEKGYVSIELKYKEGTKEIEKRIIKNRYTYMRKQIGGITGNTHTPICENAKDNNTSINNTSNMANSKKADLGQRFNAIWKLYPNKKGKENAFKAYQKAIKDGETDLVILDGIKKYNQEIKLKGTKKEYIAYGSTWFSQRRWSDEYELPHSEQPKKNALQNADNFDWDKIYD